MTPSIDDFNQSVFFATNLDEHSDDATIEFCRRAGFGVIMADVVDGDYSTPWDGKWSSYDAVKRTIDKIRDAGLTFLWHHFPNQVDSRCGAIDFRSPRWDWSDVFECELVGTVVFDPDGMHILVDTGDGIEIVWSMKHRLAYSTLLIGKTIIGGTKEVEPDKFQYFIAEGTRHHGFTPGDAIYRPYHDKRFLVKYGSPLQAGLVGRFAQTWSDFGNPGMYFDGTGSAIEHEDFGTQNRLHWERAIAPYLANIPIKSVQLGGGVAGLPDEAYDLIRWTERGDSRPYFDKHNEDWDAYYVAEHAKRWVDVGTPWRKANGWWPAWIGLQLWMLDMIYNLTGRVTFQDQPGELSVLNHPNLGVIASRLAAMNRKRGR